MTTTPTRPALAAFAALVLVSGCGSTAQVSGTSTSDSGLGAPATSVGVGGNGPSNTNPTATGTSATPGGLPGRSPTGAGTQGPAVTAPTSMPSTNGLRPHEPLTIGMLRTDASTNFGVNGGGTVAEGTIDNALVAAFNAQGGLVGHHLNVVYGDVSVSAASYDTNFGAACASFTQDHKAAAVLGYVFGYVDSFETCLSKAGVPHLTTSFNVADNTAIASHPGLYALAGLSVEDRAKAMINGAVGDHILGSSSKLGVFMDECTYTQRAWSHTIKQELAAIGIASPATATMRCPGGSTDLAGAVSDIQAAQARFAIDGVDRILFVLSGEAQPLVIFAQQSESQQYHPLYIVSSLASMTITASQLPANQAKNVYQYGWLPMLDVSTSHLPAPSPQQRRCLSMLASQGVKPSAPLDYFNAYGTCDSFFLYERALQRTGGVAVPSDVIGALDGLSTAYPSALSLAGLTLYESSHRDGAVAFRPSRYTTSCSCMVYSGPQRTLQ